MNIKLKLESFENNQWMFVGIVKEDTVPDPRDNCSCHWSGSYGWGLGSLVASLWKDGSYTMENTLKDLSKQGDTVELVLDCDAGNLSLRLPTGQHFDIEIPKSKTSKLNVTLLGLHDKIRIKEN